MPLGIVSDAELQLEIDKLSGTGVGTRAPKESHVVEAEVVEKPSRGRSDGDKNVPDSLRQIIGEEAVINGRAAALELAADFGISASSASAYAKGATSTASYDAPKSSIIGHINKSRQRYIKRAGRVLGRALGAISQEKLDYTDAKDLAGIAKDMSAIIKNLEPPAESAGDGKSSSPQFVIFAPSFRKEETFEVIQVQE